MSCPADSLLDHFSDLPDPRIDRNKAHRLIDILVIAICGAICGADTWVEIAEFGQAKKAWLNTFLALPHGIPSHDTFGRVFSRLDPKQLERCFQNGDSMGCRRRNSCGPRLLFSGRPMVQQSAGPASDSCCRCRSFTSPICIRFPSPLGESGSRHGNFRNHNRLWGVCDNFSPKFWGWTWTVLLIGVGESSCFSQRTKEE